MPNNWRSEPSMSSVDNALRLLRLIGERRALRVAEAADELAVARSTAHRLMTSLRHQGFVVQEKPNGVYRPGPVLNEVGFAAIGRVDLRRVARPVLEELREATQETISLVLLEGHNVRFVDCIESPRAVRVGDRTGIVMPAHCTAAGKAVLAALAPQELDRRYAGRDLEGRTESSITAWAELRSDLERIRACGYALNLEEGENGVSAVAMAIHDHIGVPLAAIGVVVPASRLATPADADAIAPKLLAAQSTISELLSTGL